jgi:cobalt-zinc-cadmium resistance protein CzcA
VIANGDDGTPVYVSPPRRVAFAPMVRQGAVTRDGNGEIVAGIVMMRMGENSRAVVDRVPRTRVARSSRRWPAGRHDRAVLRPHRADRKTINTVARTCRGRHPRDRRPVLSMLEPARGPGGGEVIPLSMLVAFLGMRATGVSGNLMSLGAIDFGLIVDGAVIVVENAVRLNGRALPPPRPQGDAEERDELVLQASPRGAALTTFGVLIIAIVYLPILSLTGIEGKMFRPMALTVVFALAARWSWP